MVIRVHGCTGLGDEWSQRGQCAFGQLLTGWGRGLRRWEVSLEMKLKWEVGAQNFGLSVVDHEKPWRFYQAGSLC